MKLNLKTLKDEDVVEMYKKNRNAEAFHEIFDRYADVTYRFIFSRIMHKQISEDITSEVFISLLNMLDAYRKGANLKSFIIGIALNKIRHSWREKANQYEVNFDENIFFHTDFDETESIDGVIEKEEKVKEIIFKVLEKLPSNYKYILEEKFLNNRTNNEIADLLSTNTNSVRVLIHRALKKASILGKEILHEKI